MRANFNELYKEFRNRLRKYQPQSIVGVALETLRGSAPNKQDELRMAPWQIMLIVKWVLQDRMMTDVGAQPITPAQFQDLRQKLYEFPERMAAVGTGAFAITMRRLLYQQVAFQRRFTPGFLREAALLDSLPAEHSLRNLFAQRTGLTPQRYMDLAFAMYTEIIEGNLTLTPAWFQSLRADSSDGSIARFVSLISRNYEELRDFCRSLPSSDKHVASEFFEFTPIRRFPFVRTSRGLDCWHPMIFYRGMEEMVHAILSEVGSDYIEPFSRVFEAHIHKELRSTGCSMLDEAAIYQMVGKEIQVPDALLSFPGVNIFVEAKSGLFEESVMVAGAADILSHKTRALHTAISQGWSASSAVRSSSSAPQQVRESEADYLLVVTNRELSAGTGRRLYEMYPSGKFDYPSAAAQRYMPLEHIYIVSVDDFERTVAAMRDGSLDLPQFMADCVARDRSPTTGSYFFEQHLTAAGVPLGRSALIDEAIDRACDRMMQVISRAEHSRE